MPQEQNMENPYGFRGDGNELPAGATARTLLDKLSPSLAEKLEPVEDKLKEGPATVPSQVEFSPAMIAAKKMQKKSTTNLKSRERTKVCGAVHLRWRCLVQGL